MTTARLDNRLTIAGLFSKEGEKKLNFNPFLSVFYCFRKKKKIGTFAVGKYNIFTEECQPQST